MVDRRSNLFGAARRTGFSLVELLAVIGIIVLVAGILLVSFGAVTRSAESAASQAAVTSISVGVETFKTEFGFLPPLIRDNPQGAENIIGPLDTNPMSNPDRVSTGFYLDGNAPLQRDYGVLFGETFNPNERHFSVYSLSYYLVGVLPGAFEDGRALDGVDGPGFFAPDRSGGWKVSANIDAGNNNDPLRDTLNLTTYEPFVSASSNGFEIQRTLDRPMDGLAPYRLELAGRDGVPIRYYRWLPGEYNGSYDSLAGDAARFDLRQLNVPDIFGDPANDEVNNWWDAPMRDPDLEVFSPAFENSELRSARYAIVSAGPDGVFGDEVTIDGDAGSMERDAGYRLLSSARGADEARLRNDDGFRARILREARADNVFVVGKP